MSSPSTSHHWKVAVITGGGGIGKATARALAREGMLVAIGDIDDGLTSTAAADIGSGAIGLALDVTDTKACNAFLDRVEELLGPLRVLVNNAGIMPIGPIDEEDDAMTVRHLAINLHAVIHGTREAVRRMKPRQADHIFNVSGVGGKIAASHLATYTATKFGGRRLLRSGLAGVPRQRRQCLHRLPERDEDRGGLRPEGPPRGHEHHAGAGRRRHRRRDPEPEVRRAGPAVPLHRHCHCHCHEHHAPAQGPLRPGPHDQGGPDHGPGGQHHPRREHRARLGRGAGLAAGARRTGEDTSRFLTG